MDLLNYEEYKGTFFYKVNGRIDEINNLVILKDYGDFISISFHSCVSRTKKVISYLDFKDIFIKNDENVEDDDYEEYNDYDWESIKKLLINAVKKIRTCKLIYNHVNEETREPNAGKWELYKIDLVIDNLNVGAIFTDDEGEGDLKEIYWIHQLLSEEIKIIKNDIAIYSNNILQNTNMIRNENNNNVIKSIETLKRDIKLTALLLIIFIILFIVNIFYF